MAAHWAPKNRAHIMAQKVDVLLIGAGVAGVCSANFLQQQGRDVTLVEKDEVCAGSSYGNAGLIVPSHSVPLAEPGAIGQGLPNAVGAAVACPDRPVIALIGDGTAMYTSSFNFNIM